MLREPATMERKRWTEGLTGYHYLVLTVAALGWLFDTMDQWLYVLARQPALIQLIGANLPPEVANLSPAEIQEYVSKSAKSAGGYVQAIFLFGWATGGLFFGVVGDRLGRTRTMAITVLMYAVFTGMSAMSTSVYDFAFYRFLTGLGIGGEFAAGASLIAEVFPEHARTTALGIMQACSALGNMLAGVIGLTVSSLVVDEGRWRWYFVAGLAPAVLVFIIRAFIKEPDKWHEARAEAKRSGIQLGAISELFTNPVLRRNMIAGVGLAAVGVIGFWGIATFSPDLLRETINPGKDPALSTYTEQMVSVAVIAQNFGAFFGMLGFAYFAQRIGRRATFAIAFVACSVVVPFVFHMTTSASSAFLLFPIMGVVTASLFGGFAVYFPELFPTRLRATGTGICYNVARYIAMAGPFLSGILAAELGIRMAMTYVAAVFLLGLVVLRWAPETKGKPLPE